MKKLFYLVIISLVIASCNMQPVKKTSYSISVKIEGLTEGTVYLSQRKDGVTLNIDSADAAGEILFKGNIDSPEVYSLNIKGKRGGIPVFVDASDITVSGNIDNLREITITGSPAQDELNAFKNQTKIYDEQLSKLSQDYRAANQEQNKEAQDELEKQIDSVNNKKIEFTYNYIIEHKASVVAAYLAVQNNYYFELSQLEAITTGFDPSIDGSTYVITLKDRVKVLESVAIGKPYIDFTMNNPEGEPVKFSSYLSGKYTLVDFWASWCGPCRRENPNVVAVYNDYKDKGFDIIGVSLDRDKDKWLEAIESDHLTWHHLSDLKYWSSEAAKLYGVNSIPHSILLDPKGIIIAKNLRGEELRAKISELLDK